MSEEVLKALMQLFGITARLDGVSEVERRLVEEFLSQQLNPQDVSKYLTIFETYATQKTSEIYEEGVKLTPVRFSSRMLRIATRINQELTQQQKVIVLVRLMELINTDHQITPQEEDFVDTVATVFNISTDEYKAIKHFVLTEEQTHFIEHPCLLFLLGHVWNGPSLQSIEIAHLQGSLVVLRVPSVEVYLVKYIGTREYYLNGVLMRPLHIYPFPPGSSLRGSRIEPVYYSDVVSHFLKQDHREPLQLRAQQVSYRFAGGRFGIQPFSLCETGGHLVGIMGASGSGKSTMLELLAGIRKPHQGSVLLNGKDVYAGDLGGAIGFVPQSDLLIEELTVYENLYYAARLCMGHASRQEIEQVIQKTLRSLGLEDIQHLRVGDQLERVLSGGQRKRLNIALELLREPSVLFVDEPTSGLSSRDSENIMDLLKELALKGKLVITVLHQPSSNLFKMLDSLYILDMGGYLIYAGKPTEALIYFKRAAGQINSEQIECIECGNIEVEQLFEIIEMRVVDEYGRFTTRRKRTPAQWYALYQAESQNKELSGQTLVADLPSRLVRPSWIQQCLIFFRRDWRSKLSSTPYVLLTLLQAPLLAYLLAYINRYYPLEEGQKQYTFYYNSNLPAYIFIAVIIALFIGLIMSAEEMIKDKRIRWREQFLELNRHSYLLAKVGALFMISALQTFLLTLVGNYVMGIEWALFDEYWMVLFSTACFANLLGLNISSAFRRSAVVYISIPLLLIPQLILGGIVVRFDRMNPKLVANTSTHIPAISNWITARWAFEALMLVQFRDNSYMQPQYRWHKRIAEAEYKAIFLMQRLNQARDSIQQGIRPVFWGSMLAVTLQKDRFIQLHSQYLTLLHELYANPTKQLIPALDSLLNQMRVYYLEEQKQARVALRQWTHQQTTALRQSWQQRYLQTHNEAVERFVNNIDMGQFVRLTTEGWQPNVYLAYIDGNGLMTHFFAPYKQLGSLLFDTFWVNLLVIWSMNLLLYLTLYADLLTKLLTTAEQLYARWRLRALSDAYSW